jgi:hypothetical protein
MDEPSQGTHVPQVAAIRHSTHPVKKLDLRAQEWGPESITALWDHSLQIWHFRNDAFHGYANTQVKRYKLEELEREKNTAPEKIHRTTNNITSLPTETL